MKIGDSLLSYSSAKVNWVLEISEGSICAHARLCVRLLDSPLIRSVYTFLSWVTLPSMKPKLIDNWPLSMEPIMLTDNWPTSLSSHFLLQAGDWHILWGAPLPHFPRPSCNRSVGDAPLTTVTGNFTALVTGSTSVVLDDNTDCTVCHAHQSRSSLFPSYERGRHRTIKVKHKRENMRLVFPIYNS